MYTTTFYSFKGGVGRTMALVNSAVELANRGRRVLAVDFDLEAPGLDSFDLLRPEREVPGIVDFVREYLDTGQAPDVTRFLYQVPSVGQDAGELWVMPAGSHQRDYGVRFRDIDWADLYAKRDGYLLFEDLKAQWEQNLGADWVFIDSRTGHTDTGGICTRQLPDAVVAVFFPNEQNLRGLTKVVKEIRGEADTPRGKQIALHFVMSNVPDLDDEDEILRKQISAFRQKLSIEGGPAIVHRYDSLALLNQAVFIQERPRSRLASEYRALVEEIVSGNLADRDGSLAYVRDCRARPPWARRRDLPQGGIHDQHRKIEWIEHEHAKDGELLCEIARLYEDDVRLDDAARLFDQAIAAGCQDVDALLYRSDHRKKLGDVVRATEDAVQVLENATADPWQVARALELAEVPLDELVAAVRSRSLDPLDLVLIASELGKRNRSDVGIALLELFDDLELLHELPPSLKTPLSLLYLGAGRSSVASALLTPGDRTVDDMNITDAFNYGMAVWGVTGQLDQEPFRRVLLLAPANDRENDRENANFLQRLAVAHRVVEDFNAADAAWHASSDAIGRSAAPRTFSCWRYTDVSSDEFLDDLREIRAWIDGDDARQPRFVSAADSH